MSFRIKLKESIDTMVETVKSKVKESGGSFDWNGSAGQLNVQTPLGKVKGNCKVVAEREIEISITNKPFLISENQIKSKIEEYLG